MSERLAPVDPEVRELALTVQALEQRLSVVEASLADVRVAGQPAGAWRHQAPAVPPLETVQRDSLAALALAGRSFIVLGGAYLLRALTEGGLLPPRVGVAAGLAYATVWLVFCAREGRRRQSGASASFHGLSAALVAYPLIGEATARFGLVPPSVAATLLGTFTLSMFGIAFRTQLQSVAWFAGSGAVLSAFALAVSTGAWAAFTSVLVAAGVAALWLGYLRNWVLLRWPLSAAANLMAIALAVRLVAKGGAEPIAPTVAVLLVLSAAYLGSFVVRTLALGRDAIAFEVVQAAAVTLVGFGGAIVALHALGRDVWALGAAALLLGGAAYVFTFGVLIRRGHWRSTGLYLVLALAFTTTGAALVVPAQGLTFFFIALTGIGLEAARRFADPAVALHACAYAASAALTSGLLGVAAEGLLGSIARPWTRLSPEMGLALAAAAACVVWAAPARGSQSSLPAHAARVASLGLLSWCAVGLALAVGVPAIAGTPGGTADAGLAATIRTGALLCVMVGLLAWPSGSPATATAWVAYGWLAAGGLKLLAEDLPRGRPATLFAGFALYGAALILVPKMAKQRLARAGSPPDPVGQPQNVTSPAVVGGLRRPDGAGANVEYGNHAQS